MVIICRTSPNVDATKREMVKRPNCGFLEVPGSSSSFVASWMIFRDHLGNRPAGRRVNPSPRITHSAIAVGMSDITGRKHLVKPALMGS